MVLHEVTIDGIDHCIFIMTSKKKAYSGLSLALLGNLDDDQLKEIITVNRNGKKLF
jgi:hypothetical protein